MAGSPCLKVYDAHGKYMAACVQFEAAAAVVSLYGDGATIRYHHGPIIWREGTDGHAGESYDHVAIVGRARVERYHQEHLAKVRSLTRRQGSGE